MVIISNFKLRFNNNEYKVQSYQESYCPKCNDKLSYIGTRKRRLINEYGDRVILRVRRLRCDNCRRVHIELPDIAVPYHLYCYEIIESVYIGKKSLVPIDDQTFRRLKAYSELIDKYTSSIVSIGFREKIVVFYTHFASISHTHSGNLSPS